MENSFNQSTSTFNLSTLNDNKVEKEKENDFFKGWDENEKEDEIKEEERDENKEVEKEVLKETHTVFIHAFHEM